MDCRHIDHFALNKVQAMQPAKNMKTHNSQFCLCNEQPWLQSNITAVCPRLFEILTTLTFEHCAKKHIVSTASETIAKTKKRTRQKQKSNVVHVLPAMYHVLSRAHPQDIMSMPGSQKKKRINEIRNYKKQIPAGDFLHYCFN